MTAKLDRIRCPVLFVGGAADPAVPQQAVRSFRDRVLDLQVEIIPSTSHLVPVEAPDRFNAVLLRFLARIESPEKTPDRGGEQA